jgi:uncharacterized protein YoxC
VTDEDLKREVHDLADKVEKLEGQQDRLSKLPDAVSRLEGAVSTLTRVVNMRFDNVDKGVKEAKPGWDFWLKFIIGAVVPVAIAIISGYFLLKAGLAGAGH